MPLEAFARFIGITSGLDLDATLNQIVTWRGIAMRSDKTARNYYTALCLAATLQWVTTSFSNTA